MLYRSLALATLALLSCSALASAAPRSEAIVVAYASRCNAMVVNEAESQIRTYASHPPATAERDRRLAALQALIEQLQNEGQILGSTCASDESRAPIEAQLRAAIAWASVQQADLAVDKFAVSCPAAQRPVEAGFLAAAWLELAKATPDSGPAPKSVTDVVPMVQSRAAEAKLTLPTVAETSAYWRDQVQAKGKEALADCPQQ